ncbi:MAG: DEAD/DEAH box helicase [Pseudomonadota bacterium]
MESYTPGELVRARGREWVVMEADDQALQLRPLSGSEVEIETIIPALESEPVSYASFDPPKPERTGTRASAQLLRDALRLSLRRGAGPFRSAGRINFEPRAYQLAPLMMALRQQTIRLLNADDVGIGKTIETGLILRELLDRGEIDSFTILCPPHLVDQWVQEMNSKFSLPVTAVTAGAAARLERALPANVSVFEAHPYTVVSLDFIKSERRFWDFKRACPNMVVVDEAHMSVSRGQGRQRRYELVRALADDPDRHMVLLTATPHSGDEMAFHNLLGLLDRDFERLPETSGNEYRSLRERLANHFIQRRRRDIDAWREPGLFPQHERTEAKYRLTGDYERFYGQVLEYCAQVVEAEEGETRQRLAFWGTLALMRCVGSSPAAAARSLRTRAQIDPADTSVGQLPGRILDEEELAENDLEPGSAVQDRNLDDLIRQADALSENFTRDPKFKALVKVLSDLVDKGFSPVVFCRYVATADQVGRALDRKFKNHEVDVITGALPSEEREKRAESLGEKDRRILVATDCLSEGINLQEWFDAAVHYDLSWNPTRHQQRVGRIDRFGQPSATVRSVLMYGENNPVDGAVLDVILRKAQAIEEQTGVRVPMPDDNGSLTQALMSRVMLRARDQAQMSLDLDFTNSEEARDIELAWSNAQERERKARTIFAQNTLQPEEVAQEWDISRKALGDYQDTERFVRRAMTRLSAPLQERRQGGYLAPLHLVPETLRERFIAEGLLAPNQERPIPIAFSARPPENCQSIHRAHPLPGLLAESFLEQSLDSFAQADDPATLPRTGAWESEGVDEVTWLFLLRIRHRLQSRGRLGPQFTMAEEAAALALNAASGEIAARGDAAFALLDHEVGDLHGTLEQQQVEAALSALPQVEPQLSSFAQERATALAEDHTRVRQVLGSRAQVQVQAVTPTDVVGLYVLLPRL